MFEPHGAAGRADVTNILVAGVGGQGILLASRVLGEVALRRGLCVKMSEVHGMAQRGGSVVTHVRFGKEVHSPLVPKGQADVLVAFELLEGLRWLEHTRKTATVILNDRRIPPQPVILGTSSYPEDPVGTVRSSGRAVIVVPALRMATECGVRRAENTVMLGILAFALQSDPEPWTSALADVVPTGTLEPNRRAFVAGYEWAASASGRPDPECGGA